MSTYCRNHGSKMCGNMLRRAIRSVLTQDFEDIEFVIMDDGSKDGTEAVCKEYVAVDKRVRYVRFEQNSGRPAVRYNDGMKMARADYFMFMFDDDFWYQGAVKSLHGAISGEHKGCGMVYGLIDLMDGRNGMMTSGFGGEWSLEAIRKNNLLGNASVVVTREAIDAVGGYDESELLRRLCDWDLWVRIGMRFPVARIPVVVGRSTAFNEDSVGMTFKMEPGDLQKIMSTWDSDTRTVRLRGEMCRGEVK